MSEDELYAKYAAPEAELGDTIPCRLSVKEVAARTALWALCCGVTYFLMHLHVVKLAIIWLCFLIILVFGEKHSAEDVERVKRYRDTANGAIHELHDRRSIIKPATTTPIEGGIQ